MNKLLKQKIDNSTYVSFDIFDTLILRKVIHPHDIFEIVEHKYKKIFGDTFFGLYKQLRFQAENKARELNYIKGLDDPDFDTIFECLKEKCRLNAKQIEYLKNTELQTEIEFCVKNNYMFKVYDYCLKNNKKIIFNSDMYLSKDTILKMLEKNNYKDFDKLYVSSDSGFSKNTGKAYINILQELKINPEEILHIGDNPFSDIEKAQEHGINTFYYQKPVDRASKCKHFMQTIDKPLKFSSDRLLRSVYKAIIVNNCYSNIQKQENDFWYDIGFKKGGFLVSNYLFWILKQAKEHDVDFLSLFSRDGYILEKLLNIYKKHNPNIPDYNYILSSRWAFLIASLDEELKEVDAENILFNLALNIDNLSERIEFLRLEPDKYKDYFKEFIYLSKTDTVFGQEKKDKLLNTKLIKNILKDIKKVSLKERERFKKYFNKQGMLNSKKIGVIDAFGHGTCQHYLEKCLSKMDTQIEEIKGYYLGIYSPDGINKKYKNLNQKGFLFDSVAYDYHLMPIRDVYFYELLVTAPHGSFIGFKDSESSEFNPVFDNDNLSSKNEIINNIHNGIIDFFKEYIHAYEYLEQPDVSPETILKITSRLMRKPSMNEANHIGNIPVIDSGSKEIAYIAKPVLKDIKRLFDKNHPPHNWPEAYYKRLFLGFENLYKNKLLTIRDVLYSKKLAKNIVKIKKEYKNKKVCFYGAGALAKSIFEKFDFSPVEIQGVIDRNIAKKGQQLGEYQILHTSDLKDLNPDIVIISILRGKETKPYLQKLKNEEKLSFEVVELF